MGSWSVAVGGDGLKKKTIMYRMKIEKTTKIHLNGLRRMPAGGYRLGRAVIQQRTNEHLVEESSNDIDITSNSPRGYSRV
jgi:hypothetical protein